MFNHYFSLVISVFDGLELLPIDIIALERNRQFRTMFMDGKRPERPFIILFPISINTLYTRSHIYIAFWATLKIQLENYISSSHISS